MGNADVVKAKKHETDEERAVKRAEYFEKLHRKYVKRYEEMSDYEKGVFKGMEDRQVYVKHGGTSKSGMTRRFKFYTTIKGDIQNITEIIAKISEETLDKNGYIVARGCGMDMVFSVLSNFNYSVEFLKTKKFENYSNYYIDANNYRWL